MADEEDIYSDSQKYWLKEIERAEKYFDKWWKRADKLVNLYRKQNSENSTKRRFSMLWANTEVLKPAVYARAPVPQVSRRYKDKDPVGRVASELLERASTYECERMNLDEVLRNVRDDLLLPGRGQAWVRFSADVSPEDQVADQKCVVDYVNWRQFLHGPAPTWALVPWVCKIVPMGDKEGEARFKEKWKASKSSDAKKSENDERNPNKGQDKTDVYEIWCKKTKKVHFIIKGALDVLEEGQPPLDFENFFPCPKPVYATTTTDSTVPIPDYVYYQDQAEEIDDLTARIAKLTDALKLVGFYPAGGPEDVSTAIEKALKPGVENTMIPVSSWAAFAEKGGSGGIVYLPIKEVAETIKYCVELRTQLTQDVYQIAGISDIQRGASDPNETAKAQEIKSQWGSVRVRDRQQELARFARDIIRLCCEIIAENFDPMRVMQMANMVPPPPPQPPPSMMGHNGGPPMGMAA